jgi:hypothetical protein
MMQAVAHILRRGMSVGSKGGRSRSSRAIVQERAQGGLGQAPLTDGTRQSQQQNAESGGKSSIFDYFGEHMSRPTSGDLSAVDKYCMITKAKTKTLCHRLLAFDSMTQKLLVEASTPIRGLIVLRSMSSVKSKGHYYFQCCLVYIHPLYFLPFRY